MFKTKIAHKAFSLLLGIIVLAGMTAIVCPISSTTPLLAPETAHAQIYVGNEPIGNTWQPSDMVHSDVEISTEQAASKMENTLVKLIRTIMPILMIACVGIIVYNAIRNLFTPAEKRVRMGDVIKNMFVQFFFIFFAWIIVEGIVFVVTGGETLLFSILLS